MKTLEGTSSSPSPISRFLNTSSSKHQTMHACGDMGGSGCEAPRLRERLISVGMSGMEPLQDEARDVLGNQFAAPRNEKSSIAQHRFSPIHRLQASGIHVNLLSTNLLSPGPRPLRAIPPVHIPEGMVLPISSLDAGKGIFDSQTDLTYENTGVATNPHAKWLNNISTHDVDTSRVDLCTPIFDHIDSESATNFSMALCPVKHLELMEDFMIPMIGYSMPDTEVEPSTMSNNGQNEILTQSHDLIKKGSDVGINSGDEPRPGAIIPSRYGRARKASDKLRRDKISDGIKALENSLPFSDKGNKESVLDDVIDYIKFLKLQLKVLSQSRLCGEATPYPLVYLEGYGNYLIHQQMCGEPLEEIMGQLMDVNMQAAIELLESKGLAILPMDLAYTLLQTG